MKFKPQYLIVFLVIIVFYLNNSFAEEIHTAAKSGKVKQVESLLNNQPDLLNAKNSKGLTPLHSAISKGRLNVVKLLIKKGADPELKTKNGLTPIFQALDLGRNKIAQELIESGVNIKTKGYRNRTLLHMAARSGSTPIIQQLINKGIHINAKDGQSNTALDLAVTSGKVEAAKLLLKNGGKTGSFSLENEETQNIVNRNIYFGSTDFIEVLTHLNEDLNFIDGKGFNPLHTAAAYGKLDIVELLLTNGLNVSSKAGNGKTAIYLAAKYGYKNVVDFLLNNDANESDIVQPNYGMDPSLKNDINENEAHIWYLDHSGWAVRTKNHLLIFDYVEFRQDPVNPFLAKGYINPEEIKNLNVVVFVSHKHPDHYDSKIFGWSKSIKNIQYVTGFKPKNISTIKYAYVGPREEKVINGVEVNTIKSTDSGVAFLVKADGIKIYHSGDHANKKEVVHGEYHKEIDYLANIEPEIDIAFVLAGSACGGGYTSCVLQGDFYAIKKLSPKVVFPMHSGGREYIYKKFASDALNENINASIHTAEFRGDRYHYTNGKIN